MYDIEFICELFCYIAMARKIESNNLSWCSKTEIHLLNSRFTIVYKKTFGITLLAYIVFINEKLFIMYTIV